MISNKKSNKTNMEGLNSRLQSVNDDAKSIELVQLQKTYDSELYHADYVPALSCIQEPSLQQLYEVLKRYEFICYQKPETQSILKICTKSTWESLTYRVKIGNLETQINVFRMSVDSKNYTPTPIAKGQFGKVSRLHYQNTDYVLKSVTLKSGQSQELSSALREVFMAKLASCLQVGPYFSDIYGYDAILFTDCLQFSMEMCDTNYNEKQIRDELNAKNLLKSMKILHNLNICHSDIKLDNIGRSNRLNKFVFLDFGFAKYVHEPLGFKTFAKFEGTYKYSSDQMKKIYLLRNRAYVDLYYNDLHGLQKTLAQLNDLMLINEVELFNLNESIKEVGLDYESVEDQQKKVEENFSELVPFFRLKFLLFKQDQGKVVEIVKSERVLICAFRKVLYDFVSSTSNYKFSENLAGIYEKYVQSCIELEKTNVKIHKLDALLCNYLLQVSCEGPLSHNQKLKQIAQRENCLSFIQEAWGREVWMEELFYFLDDDVCFRQRVIKNLNLLTDLFLFVRKNVHLSEKSPLKRLPQLKYKTNPASMLHDVMIMFFDYFYEKKKPEILELILPYFITFCDEYNCEQMEILILRLYESDNKTYVAKNLQFLVGKRLALLGYERRIEISDNLANVNKVIKRLRHSNESLDINFLQYLEDTVVIMNIVNSLRIYDGCLFKIQLIRQQLNAYSLKYENFQPDVSEILLKMIPIIYENSLRYLNIKFLKNSKNSNLKTRYFKTKYLKLVQLNALYLTFNDQSNILQKIFLQSYFPFSNFQGIYILGKIEQSLLEHYLQVRKFHNFGITQFQIGILIELKQQKDRRIVEEFLLNYFDDFQLERIKSIEDIVCVLNTFSRLICITISYQKKVDLEILQQKISKKALEFIEWTEYFVRQFEKQFENSQTGIKKEQFVYLRKLCYACSVMGLGLINKSAVVFLDLFTNNRLPNQTAFSYLCGLYQDSNGKKQDKNLEMIAAEISQINTFINLVTQEVRQLLCSPVAFRPLIVANCEKRGVFETFQILIKLLTLLNAENSFFVSLHSKPLIEYFVGILQPGDTNLIVTNILNTYKLPQIVQFPGISILLFQLYLKSGGVDNFLETSVIIKLLIYCAFGFEQINSNSMTWIKKYLLNQITKYFGLKRKFKISTQFLFMKKKNFKILVDKQLKKVTSKRKTPQTVKDKLQITLQRVVRFHRLFFFQQVNQV